jgi:transposase
MKAFSDVRDKVLVAIKHEKAAYDRKVERCAKNRRTYRTKHPKRYKGRKRGRKAKWRKKDFKPSTMKNGESKMDFLRRSFYTLRTCPDKWSDEQWERMDILFDEFPELKEAFDLKEEFRKLYWSKRDKEEYKDSLPAMEERNALKETVRENLHVWFDHVKKSKSPGMKTFMRTIKEREENLLNYYETFVTNASAESLNSGIKGFRAELHGISNLPFFFYRVCKIYG